MRLIDLYVETKTNNVAEIKAIVLRENDAFRTLFSTKIIDNHNNIDYDLHGTLYVQRKTKSQKWEDLNTLKINKLKAEEWGKFDLKSEDLSILLQYCNELKKKYREEGKYNFFDSTRVLLVDDNNSNNVNEIIDFINNNPNGKELLDSLTQINNDKVIEFLNNDINNLAETINNLSDETNEKIYSLLMAKVVNPEYIKRNLNNPTEEYWQDFFEKNPLVISSMFPSIFHIISSKQYCGGKSISNNNGVLGDFLFQFGLNNVCFVEIKTPCTKLLNNTPYRKNLYSISDELSGAIVQIRKQKDSFLKEFTINHYNSSQEGIDYSAYDPKTVLIVGNTENMTNYQLESFELFRRELKDIDIVTYNELVDKLTLLNSSIKID